MIDLPDVTVEDEDHNERGWALWVFVAGQGFYVDYGSGSIWPYDEDDHSPNYSPENRLPDLYWHDYECYYCGAPLSTSYPAQLLSDPTLRFCTAACARRHAEGVTT